jgi:toxin-antitoxin system PIN domain toxin
MTSFLLDVNVLASLMIPGHESHDRCRTWFLQEGRQAWLTCPITQNGAIRLAWNPAISGRRFTIRRVAEELRLLTTVGNHRFIHDSVSLLDVAVFDLEVLDGPKQTTDTYLLGLAAMNDATFATMDRGIVNDSVRSPNAKVHLI